MQEERGAEDKGVFCELIAWKLNSIGVCFIIITQAILDDLTRQAQSSPRLRMNLDLRSSVEDNSQRMLNAIEPGSPERIHRHQHTSETVVCLRGRVVEEFYDEQDGSAGSPQAICTESVVLTPNGPNVAINIPAGQWHSIRAVETGSVVLAVKDGKYEPQSPADVLSL